jgi:hypothetical protein
MLAARRQHKYILYITNAFIKYALITAIENKAETVAKAIFSEWFCKLSITAQVHTDGGKEFVNKLSRVLFDVLNVENTKMNLAHPQCNAQVEVFNKTVKKYLASFVDDYLGLGKLSSSSDALLQHKLPQPLSNFYFA